MALQRWTPKVTCLDRLGAGALPLSERLAARSPARLGRGGGLRHFLGRALFVVATFALWLFDRPGWTYRWKVACLSGLASAGLGLLIAQAISHVLVRERPFVAHPSQTLLAAPSHEPSFPSDHAVAAFAIAFTVLLVGSRRVGVLYLLGATAVGLTRDFVGIHYPGDVAGGALVGLVAALIVFYGGRSRWSPIIAGISRLADPVVAPAWRALDARRRRRRHA